jgi:hypothetical protein
VAPWAIATHGNAHVLGQLNLHKSQPEQVMPEPGIAAKLYDRGVTVTHAASGRTARFDIAGNEPVLTKLLAPLPAPPAKRSIVQVGRASGELGAELWIVGAHLRRAGTGVASIEFVNVFLVVQDLAPARTP